MTCQCQHIALAHQYLASTAANDGECLAPQCPCGGCESGQKAHFIGGLSVEVCENRGGPKGAPTPTSGLDQQATRERC